MANKKSATMSTTNAPCASPSGKSQPTTLSHKPKTNPALLNAKHHQPPAKKQVHSVNKREFSSEQKQSVHPNATTPEKGSLKELLFAASEKQKTQQKDQQRSRSRKTTTSLVITSSAYAGAAFDRAPTGESFPMPSFVSKSRTIDDDSLLSSSCPLPSGPLAALSLRDTTSSTSVDSSPPRKSTNKTVLKTLSINDLLGPSPQPSTPSKPSRPQSSSSSPPSKEINVASQPNSKQQDLNAMTQNLRKMLNISK